MDDKLKKIYSLNWDENAVYTTAFSPQDSPLLHDLINHLEGKRQMPFRFELKRIVLSKKKLLYTKDFSNVPVKWSDYLTNDLTLPLMSLDLKNIIAEKLTGSESVDWITVSVEADNENKIYYIPRFNNKLDVLNLEYTKFIPGTDYIKIPYFSNSKVKIYAMFGLPNSGNFWKITYNLYVSQDLKDAISESKICGLRFNMAKII